MGRAPLPTADPALERLREVAERIRRRAAEGRVRGAGAPFRPALPVPVEAPPAPGSPDGSAPPPPRHWSDGPADDGDEGARH